MEKENKSAVDLSKTYDPASPLVGYPENLDADGRLSRALARKDKDEIESPLENGEDNALHAAAAGTTGDEEAERVKVIEFLFKKDVDINKLEFAGDEDFPKHDSEQLVLHLQFSTPAASRSNLSRGSTLLHSGYLELFQQFGLISKKIFCIWMGAQSAMNWEKVEEYWEDFKSAAKEGFLLDNEDVKIEIIL
ncbi:hypothetical protein G7Y89_g12502 [Cudoniella acicularis]|uniref:Uncharacterized protein n=1 Tax=Cudoniella acicularis TaxID=354080 RepID=A0A8H4VXA7_9HELO|nr:hypothetical protein G7Y89_g12502 [Cudoniella acicularis]